MTSDFRDVPMSRPRTYAGLPCAIMAKHLSISGALTLHRTMSPSDGLNDALTVTVPSSASSWQWYSGTYLFASATTDLGHLNVLLNVNFLTPLGDFTRVDSNSPIDAESAPRKP